MDTKKDCKIPHCGDLMNSAEFDVVIGAKQLKKALRSGCAKQVFLAENADPALTDDLAQQCDACNVPWTWAGSMKELGTAWGIEVGAAAVTLVLKI